MKHLKKFNEDSGNIGAIGNDVVEDIKDIFVELKDDGYDIRHRYFSDRNTNGLPPYDVYQYKIIVNIFKDHNAAAKGSSLRIDDIYDYIERTYEYLGKDYIMYVHMSSTIKDFRIGDRWNFNHNWEWPKLKEIYLKGGDTSASTFTPALGKHLQGDFSSVTINIIQRQKYHI
jgi:hypothetical protein